jgi:DNA repair protein RadA/Sms
VAAAVSAFTSRALNARLVCLGEVGLTGAIRTVGGAGRRLAEAARVGLDLAVVPPGTEVPLGVEVIEVATVHELLVAMPRLAGGPGVGTIRTWPTEPASSSSEH